MINSYCFLEILAITLLLSSCSIFRPSASSIETAIAQTQTAKPTQTKVFDSSANTCIIRSNENIWMIFRDEEVSTAEMKCNTMIQMFAERGHTFIKVVNVPADAVYICTSNDTLQVEIYTLKETSLVAEESFCK